MKTQPLESNSLLVGLTRGLWWGAPVDRRPERLGTSADAASGRSAEASDTEMPGVGRTPSRRAGRRRPE